MHIVCDDHGSWTEKSEDAAWTLSERAAMCAVEQFNFGDRFALPDLLEIGYLVDGPARDVKEKAIAFIDRESQMEMPLNALLGLAVMIPGDPSVSGFKLLEETFDECVMAHKWYYVDDDEQ